MQANQAPPEMPEPPMAKPMVPYLRFSKEYWNKVHSGEIEGHDQKSEMSKVIAKRWHELDDETKAAYVAAYTQETREYKKVMAGWKTSEAMTEYEESLKNWRAKQKQQEIEARIKREQAQAAARAQAMHHGTSLSDIDYIQAYHDDLSVVKPGAAGPPFTTPLATATPLARLDAHLERLQKAAKFPAEQWAQAAFNVGAHSVHATAKARYQRNECYMREVFCRKISTADLEGAAAVVDPEEDAQLAQVLLDAIKRTRDEIAEMSESPPKRLRPTVDVAFTPEAFSEPEGSLTEPPREGVIQPLLRVGQVLKTEKTSTEDGEQEAEFEEDDDAQ